MNAILLLIAAVLSPSPAQLEPHDSRELLGGAESWFLSGDDSVDGLHGHARFFRNRVGSAAAVGDRGAKSCRPVHRCVSDVEGKKAGVAERSSSENDLANGRLCFNVAATPVYWLRREHCSVVEPRFTCGIDAAEHDVLVAINNSANPFFAATDDLDLVAVLKIDLVHESFPFCVGVVCVTS